MAASGFWNVTLYSARIQNCIGWSVSPGWSMSFQV
jgi:hypothetical protein